LAEAPQLARLTALDLEGNRIGRAGARWLAESPHLRNLTFLAVSPDSLDRESLELLGERFGSFLHLS
jgi:hypothetical protein